MNGRFWSKVVHQHDGCWHWIGAKYHDGYGAFSVTVAKGVRKMVRAHRYAG